MLPPCTALQSAPSISSRCRRACTQKNFSSAEAALPCSCKKPAFLSSVVEAAEKMREREREKERKREILREKERERRFLSCARQKLCIQSKQWVMFRPSANSFSLFPRAKSRRVIIKKRKPTPSRLGRIR
jgi:hypothetical protein